MLNGYSNLSQRNHLTLRYCARKSLSLHVLFPSFSFSFFEFFPRVFRRRGKVNHLCWEEFHCETMCLSFSFDVSLSSGVWKRSRYSFILLSYASFGVNRQVNIFPTPSTIMVLAHKPYANTQNTMLIIIISCDAIHSAFRDLPPFWFSVHAVAAVASYLPKRIRRVCACVILCFFALPSSCFCRFVRSYSLFRYWK